MTAKQATKPTPKPGQPTPEKPFRVCAELIQVQGEPRSGWPKSAVLQRHLRRGDLLPDWVPDPEAERLLAGGFVEVQS